MAGELPEVDLLSELNLLYAFFLCYSYRVFIKKECIYGRKT